MPQSALQYDGIMEHGNGQFLYGVHSLHAIGSVSQLASRKPSMMQCL